MLACDAASPPRRLISSKRPLTLAPVRPNAGHRDAYQVRLDALLAEMHRSLVWYLRAAYRAKPPEMAQDRSPARTLQAAFNRLAKRWQDRFDEAAPELAEWFARGAMERSDVALQASLKRAGFSVPFKLTAPMNDVLQATIGANVSLIKSVAQEHLTQVEGAVMRSVQAGRDIGALTKEIETRYAISRRKAATIARHQNNICTASITRVRQQGLGITHAVWVHSAGGNTPRPEHVKAGRDKLVYEISKGAFLEGKWVWPGTEINCFPGDMAVSLSDRPQRLWRTPFNGPMVHVNIGPDLLKGTPNHPVLTSRGWVPLGSLEDGDQVVCMVQQGRDVVHNHKDKAVATFDELFEACLPFGHMRLDRGVFDFHGHRPDSYVDEVVVVNDDLLNNWKPAVSEDLCNLALAKADAGQDLFIAGGIHQVASSGSTGLLDVGRPLLNSLASGTAQIGGGSASYRDVMLDQYSSNICGSMAGRSSPLSDGDGAQSLFIESDNLFRHRVPVEPRAHDVHGAELLAKIVRRATDEGRSVFDCGSVSYELRSISNKVIRDFSGHVFTMQSQTGYYGVGDAFVQAKNCRCVSRSVIPGFT